VSEEEDVVAILESAVDGLGCIDLLVNNGAIQISSPSHEISTSDFAKVLAVNPSRCVSLRRRGGQRLPGHGNSRRDHHVSSVHQVIPKPNYLAYSMSKGGMESLTRRSPSSTQGKAFA